MTVSLDGQADSLNKRVQVSLRCLSSKANHW